MIANNHFGAASDRPHVLARGDGGDGVTGLTIVGNRFEPSTAGEFVRLVDARRCVVADNTFLADSSMNVYVDGPNATGNSITNNTYYAPDPPADPIREDEGSVATGNQVHDLGGGGWL